MALRSVDWRLSRRAPFRSGQPKSGCGGNALVPDGIVRDAGRLSARPAARTRARTAAHYRTAHHMTTSAGYEVLFHRHPANPILTAADWPYPAHTVFNAGATRLLDGTTLLLCRVED